MNAKVITIFSLKASTGKTTLASFTAYCMSRQSKKVLLIKLEQSYASKKSENCLLSEALNESLDIKQAIVKSIYFDMIECDNADSSLRFISFVEDKFKKSTESIKHNYDYIIIDTCSDEKISALALYASDYYLITFYAGPFSASGLCRSLDFIVQGKQILKCKLAGLVHNKHNVEYDIKIEGLEELKREKILFETKIRDSAKIGAIILDYITPDYFTHDQDLLEDVITLTQELLNRISHLDRVDLYDNAVREKQSIEILKQTSRLK